MKLMSNVKVLGFVMLGRIKDPCPITKLRDLITAALIILEQHMENQVGIRFMLNINKIDEIRGRKYINPSILSQCPLA